MVGFKRKPKSPSVATPWSLALVISSSFARDGELLQIYVVPCCRVPLGIKVQVAHIVQDMHGIGEKAWSYRWTEYVESCGQRPHMPSS